MVNVYAGWLVMMRGHLEVRIGDLVFTRGVDHHRTGFVILDKGFKGWWGGVSFRREALDRPFAHGRFNVPGYMGERLISLKGVIMAGSPFELARMKSQLTASLAWGQTGLLEVESDAGSERVTVSLASLPEPVDRDATTAEFTVQWTAASPFIGGNTNTFAGSSVQAFHYGSVDAWPWVVVTGAAASGYTISGPGGQSVVVRRALVAGTPHRIEFSTGGLFIAGVRQPYAFTSAFFWPVPPGTGVPMSINNGLSMTVNVMDTRV